MKILKDKRDKLIVINQEKNDNLATFFGFYSKIVLMTHTDVHSFYLNSIKNGMINISKNIIAEKRLGINKKVKK